MAHPQAHLRADDWSVGDYIIDCETGRFLGAYYDTQGDTVRVATRGTKIFVQSGDVEDLFSVPRDRIRHIMSGDSTR